MKQRSLVFVCASIGLLACHPQSDDSSVAPWQTRTTAGAERRSSSDPESTGAASSTATAATATATTAASTTTPASALPTSAITTLAAMMAEERVLADDPMPEAPPEPPVPAPMERRVRELRVVAERTSECWMSEPYMRVMHMPPRECGTWFEQLAHGGEASGFAIGSVLSSGRLASSETLSRLAEIMATTEAHSGTAFVLRQIHSTISRDPNAAPTQAQRVNGLSPVFEVMGTVRAFEQITGFPVNETSMWENMYDAGAMVKARPMAVRALRFWQRNGDAQPSWQSLSDQRLRLWLTADDVRVIRAAMLINDRRASAHLRAEAIQALNRVNSTTSSAEARNYARAALSQLQREDQPRMRL